MMADKDNGFSLRFLDEFEKLYAELQVSKRNPNCISDDIGHSNPDTRDHDAQLLNISFENDGNVSKSCFSPQTRVFSHPETSLICQSHRNSHQSSTSNSVIGSQHINFETIEEKITSSSIFPVETPQSDLFWIDDNQSNPPKNISTQNNIWGSDWTPMPQDILKNTRSDPNISEVSQRISSPGTVEAPQMAVSCTDNNRFNSSEHFHSQNNIGWGNWSPVTQDKLKSTNFGSDTFVASETIHLGSSFGRVENQQGDCCQTDNDRFNLSAQFHSQNNIGWSNWSSVPQDLFKNMNFGTETIVHSENRHMSPCLGTVLTPQDDYGWVDSNQSIRSEEFSSQNNMVWSNCRPVPQNVFKNSSFGADASEVSGKGNINNSFVPVETPQLDFCRRVDDQSNHSKPFSSQNTVESSNWGHFSPSAIKNRSFGANISVASRKSYMSSPVPVEKLQKIFCWRDDNQQNNFERVPSQNNIGCSNSIPGLQNTFKNTSFGAYKSNVHLKKNKSREILTKSKLSHLDSTSSSLMSKEENRHEAAEQKTEDYIEISTRSEIISLVDIKNIKMAPGRLSLGSVAEYVVGPSKTNIQSSRTGKDKPFICEFCGKTYNQDSDLLVHRVIHIVEKPFVCNTCGKRFARQKYLKSHLLEHSGEWLYQCSQCDKKFTYKSQFYIHLLSHTKEILFICDICNKGFSLKSHLKSHQQTHALEKTLICDICNKGFARKQNLKSHLQTHVLVKPYTCELCGKGVCSRRSLINHLKKIHNIK